jgi:hypothetical protein
LVDAPVSLDAEVEEPAVEPLTAVDPGVVFPDGRDAADDSDLDAFFFTTLICPIGPWGADNSLTGGEVTGR